MNEIAEKLKKVDGGKLNAAAVALLTLVLFVFGNQMRALPETVADMARTQALLVYRIEQLERAVADDQASRSTGPIGNQFDRFGHRHAPPSLNLSESIPVRFQLDHLGSGEFVRQIVNARLSQSDSL
ncbi:MULTISPECIES: hypothetical protein [unclassified Marinimicrobium]|jgi:hypothetical protein|uniref:hypothetical protein n=1 Tax=unclassified Marinimicrobium TaxID=2632100 RepID=UPI000C507710|nr:MULTISPECIES: hypothetical protein [unclassified Marinimicrobium]MAN52163.1 hypothetical protein [Marinimicrobium sp.]